MQEQPKNKFNTQNRQLKRLTEADIAAAPPTPPDAVLEQSELIKEHTLIVAKNRRGNGLGATKGLSGIARSAVDNPSAATGMADKTSPRKLAITMRRQFVVNMRTAGASYADIADAVVEAAQNGTLFEVPISYDRTSAYLDVQRYLHELRSTVQDNLIDVVDLENSRLDALLMAVWPAAMGGDTRSVRSALDIMERRSKLLGLDAAIKVDWRIELRGLEKAGLLSDSAIREELGPEGYATYRQFVDEVNAQVDQKPTSIISPLDSPIYVGNLANNGHRVLPGFEDALGIAIEEATAQAAARQRQFPTVGELEDFDGIEDAV